MRAERKWMASPGDSCSPIPLPSRF
jgi:hypothetical protein